MIIIAEAITPETTKRILQTKNNNKQYIFDIKLPSLEEIRNMEEILNTTVSQAELVVRK